MSWIDQILGALAQGQGSPQAQDFADLEAATAPVVDAGAEGLKDAGKAVVSATLGLPGDLADLALQVHAGARGGQGVSTGAGTRAIGAALGADIDSEAFQVGEFFGLDPFSKFTAAAGLAVPLARRARGATDEIADAVEGFFPERKHSELFGPIDQTPLPRKRETPTGKPIKRPASLDPILTDENKDRLKLLFEKGRAVGGDRWYHTGGIRDAFIEQLGVEEGMRRFDMFMDLGAAVSPRSKVEQQLKRASVLMKRQLEGEKIAPLEHEMFPKGYGHMATRSAHSPAVERLVETGLVGDPQKQPKISSYAENQRGNYQPLTADTHNFEIISGMKRSPTDNEYAFIEDWQREIAEELGVDPAEFQAGLWVGAADITGVANPENLTAAMNRRIAKTAEVLGVSQEEAARRFIAGDEVLRAMVGTVGAGALGAGMFGAGAENTGEF